LWQEVSTKLLRPRTFNALTETTADGNRSAKTQDWQGTGGLNGGLGGDEVLPLLGRKEFRWHGQGEQLDQIRSGPGLQRIFDLGLGRREHVWQA
jgi:hypothetical protein